MRGNNVMKGYYADREATDDGVPWRMVPQRGSGRVAP